LIYLVSKHRRESVVIPELADRLFDLDPIELLNLWKACSEEWIDDAIVEGLKK
jgi:hypothetical protein